MAGGHEDGLCRYQSGGTVVIQRLESDSRGCFNRLWRQSKGPCCRRGNGWPCVADGLMGGCLCHKASRCVHVLMHWRQSNAMCTVSSKSRGGRPVLSHQGPIAQSSSMPTAEENLHPEGCGRRTSNGEGGSMTPDVKSSSSGR